MVFDPIPSWSQFWKGVLTFNTCGAPLYTLTTCFPDNSSSLRASTSDLPTSKTCNPSSTWALQCITPLIENTADLANTSNLPTRDWSKPNWPCATGTNMTTCIFGLRFPSIPTEWTTAALKKPSSKNGNHDWTTPSFANFTIPRKAFSKSPSSIPTHNLALPLFGVVPNTNSLHNWFAKSWRLHGFKTVSNFGPLSTPSDQIPRRDSNKPRCFDPMMAVSCCAMPFVG